MGILNSEIPALPDEAVADFGIEEVSGALAALLRRSTTLQEALDAKKACLLRWEGRRHVAEALGLCSPFTGTADSEVNAAARPASAKSGPRCHALDAPVLAEVCGLLCLDAAPWPAARTRTSRAERMLAVVGALVCV